MDSEDLRCESELDNGNLASAAKAASTFDIRILAPKPHQGLPMLHTRGFFSLLGSYYSCLPYKRSLHTKAGWDASALEVQPGQACKPPEPHSSHALSFLFRNFTLSCNHPRPLSFASRCIVIRR